jgi:serine protease AprX
MKKFILSSLALAFALASVNAQNGTDWQKKVTPSLLQQTRDGNSAPFIIMLDQQADVSHAKEIRTKEAKGEFVFHTLQQTAHQSQKNLAEFLEAQQVPYHSLYIVNAIHAEGSLDLIQALAMRHDVARVLDDPANSFARPVPSTGNPPDARSTIEWGIDMINANDVWDMGYTGQGIVVGGEDTGYEWSHPALKKKYRGYDAVRDSVDHNFNWHDAIHSPDPHHADTINPCGYNVQQPCDDYGHGTHTMGTMIGSDGDNQIGVAPDAQWCACRNMERGYGTPFTYIECFEWFLAPTDLNNENPDPSKAPHVINNSWGCPLTEGCDSTNYEIMNMVVNNLRAAGIVVVVSAGNDGSGCSSVYTPAAMYEGSFSIGATAPNDTIAGFSSRGPVTSDHSNRLKPNVSAPGVWVRSSVPGGNYNYSDGTSMAGPHVAGLVALMISANPALAGEVDLIENIIETTAVPKTTDQQCGDIPGTVVPNNTYGFGRVDALAAVEAALALIPSGVEDDPYATMINVYPNPVHDQLIIQMQQATGNVSLNIFDLQGRNMMRQQWDANGLTIQRVDVSGMASGFYVYTISSGDKVFQGKVVKE